jgi:hypothetical protein
VTSFPFRQPERVFFAPHDPCTVWVPTFGNGIYRGASGFTDLGFGKPGTTTPHLGACVELARGLPARYLVSDGVPQAGGLFVFAQQQAAVPLLGGTLVASPVIATLFANLDHRGATTLTITPPGTSPIGWQLVAQYWLLDAGASFGVAATNGLRATVR